jgi:hypothetical protein
MALIWAASVTSLFLVSCSEPDLEPEVPATVSAQRSAPTFRLTSAEHGTRLSVDLNEEPILRANGATTMLWRDWPMQNGGNVFFVNADLIGEEPRSLKLKMELVQGDTVLWSKDIEQEITPTEGVTETFGVHLKKFEIESPPFDKLPDNDLSSEKAAIFSYVKQYASFIAKRDVATFARGLNIADANPEKLGFPAWLMAADLATLELHTVKDDADIDLSFGLGSHFINASASFIKSMEDQNMAIVRFVDRENNRQAVFPSFTFGKRGSQWYVNFGITGEFHKVNLQTGG